MSIEYNSVLLDWEPQFKEIAPGHFVQDYYAAVFMIEQLIAAGASRIVTGRPFHTSEYLDIQVPAILRKRVVTIDSARFHRMSSALLTPTLAEFGMEGVGGGVRSLISRSIDDPLFGAAILLYFKLPDFLLACHEQVQLDFPLLDVRAALKLLFQRARDPNSRASLATLMGILHPYRPMGIEALEVHSSGSSDGLRLFMELLEDELYMKLSGTSRLIGIPAKVGRALTLASRFARRIASSAGFKPIANLTSKVISAATNLPLPDSEIASLIVRQGYMPPIVSLKNARLQARMAYTECTTNPELKQNTTGNIHDK